MAKPAHCSRTLLFNAAAAAVSTLVTVADAFAPFLPPDFYKAALAVVLVVNAVLRVFTSQPVCFRKEP
jgi:biotin transporter BioY